MKAYCVRAYAEALEIVPFTLAENAGLNPINIVTGRCICVTACVYVRL